MGICGSESKEYACSAGDLGSIPGLGRSPGEENGYPLQCSCLVNSMDCIVHGVAKSWTWLSDFPFHVYVTQWNISLSLSFFFNIFSIQFIYFFGNPTAVDIWLGCLHPWGRSARWVWQRSLPEWEPSERDRNGITKGKTSRALSSSKRTRGVAWRGKKKK